MRSAREQRGLTPSAVAESTHMKVQIVEDLEKEDFRRIAASIYGRGFVKLYAEFLQLDPEPLVRDFMELFSGARVPEVLTRPVDAVPVAAPASRVVPPAAAAPAAAGAPVASPQRQPVVARPAFRPLATPLPPEAPPVLESVAGVEEEDSGFALEAEEADPDLFRPQAPRRMPSAPVSDEDVRGAAPARVPSGRPSRRPVLQVGGAGASGLAEEPQDEESRARRQARMQAFVSSVRRLKDGVESRLPTSLPPRRFLLAGGAAALLLVSMAVGIGLLFRQTSAPVSPAKRAGVIETVAPPPDSYVD